MIKYGKFKILDPKHNDYDYYQIPITDYELSIDLSDVQFTPKKIVGMHFDDSLNAKKNRYRDLFVGTEQENGFFSGYPNAEGTSEAKAFTDSDALYVRYDESNKRLNIHLRQWDTVKTGTWIWVAIGDI